LKIVYIGIESQVKGKCQKENKNLTPTVSVYTLVGFARRRLFAGLEAIEALIRMRNSAVTFWCSSF